LKKIIEAKPTGKLNEATLAKIQNQLKLVEVKNVLLIFLRNM
jgi:hypothetical protein